MATAQLTSCVRTLPVRDPAEPQRTEMDELVELSLRPWMMRIGPHVDDRASDHGP